MPFRKASLWANGDRPTWWARERVQAPLLCIPMDRVFLVVITSALLLLLTSASLLVYRTGTPSGESAEAARKLTTVGMKR